ncbi:SDR family oxidoreductase [Actinoalloteichus caeruleus]|uniref:NADP-dependent 3-hydroxy acid dehydrogenase YdfG n=1 Tax=Actinoalloteichus caeruleus DSM 43889 TaxID=1120930 RepID=A0ABT1JFT8_ACTCY|nr:SDR family oxidoreductase [Actinoalloteichus caeruleus]MCP2331033.1 NADP-dependent 3-hydroxy acid dehydrogenase YdfG [Actinoalloteichus caeruleus DSM 43889]
MTSSFSFHGRLAVVTGGGSGIGRALASGLAEEGARVVVADLDDAAATRVAAALPGGRGVPLALDVTDPVALDRAISGVEAELGPVSVFCSNAGIAGSRLLGSPEEWERMWLVHVAAHVHVARRVLPGMVARGEGRLLVTASAAGLLTNLDSAAYAVTKHGAVAVAEWLAIEHHDAGVRVSCLCPQGVATPMLTGSDGGAPATTAAGGVRSAEDVAAEALDALRHGRFLVLSHPEVGEFERRRATDRERWLDGMRRLRRRLRPTDPHLAGGTSPG